MMRVIVVKVSHTALAGQTLVSVTRKAKGWLIVHECALSSVSVG